MVSSTSWTPPAPLVSAHKYHWWVRAAQAVWSDPLEFAALTGPQGTVNTIAPTFQWVAVNGVAQYQIYLSDLTTGGVQNEMVNTASWTPPTPLISGHPYRWCDRAANGV